MPYYKLLDNVSVNTEGEPYKGLGAGMALDIWAEDFGGGTVNIELSPDNGTTWIMGSFGGNPSSFTENKALYIIKIGIGELIRATLTGATGASNVNVMLFS